MALDPESVLERADTDDIVRGLGYEETTIATYHAAGIV